MTGSYKAIFFDLGNVWIDFDHWIAVNKFVSSAGLKPGEIFKIIFDSPYTEEFEEGRISPLDFFTKMNDVFKTGLLFKEFVTIWNEIFFLSKENIMLHEFARTLKERYFLLLLSNTNALHYEWLSKRFDVFGIFDKLVLSHEIGARKPKRKIYDEALRLSASQADEVIYIDDREDLIAESKRLGIIHSIQYKGLSLLKEELRGLGAVSDVSP